MAVAIVQQAAMRKGGRAVGCQAVSATGCTALRLDVSLAAGQACHKAYCLAFEAVVQIPFYMAQCPTLCMHAPITANPAICQPMRNAVYFATRTG